jgi:fructose-bisphosphate aldolase, class I
MSGKELRLKRIISPTDGRTVIFPMDHGVSYGPIPGLERIEDTIEAGIRGGADALVLHKGMLRCLESAGQPLPGVIMHLSASTGLGPSPCRKVLTGSVEEAVRRGADAVSAHINFGDTFESEMLKDLCTVGRSCSEWQVPLLVMAYVRGDMMNSSLSGSDIAHAVRVAAELGADVIKMPFPGDYDLLAGITASLSIPIVIAGGVPGEIDHTLQRIQNCLRAGASGVAAGRAIFQHENPEAVLRAIRDIVHREIPAEELIERLREEATVWKKRTLS